MNIDKHQGKVACLSLWNPWAALVVKGHKRWETRGPRSPLRNFTGRLLIHAAKSREGICTFNGPFPSQSNPTWLERKCGKTYYWGAIIGEVIIPDGGRLKPTWETSEALEAGLIDIVELELGDYSPGRFCTRLVDPIEYAHPIPYTGKQGLFWVEKSLLPK